MRTPIEKFFDGWAGMNMWNRFGLSFIATVAIFSVILNVLSP